ncbi:hypothetical protein ABZX75_17360 [Streptomyces sp. NPDC003038]|uniref:hypothetical protein n=1 Tax=unclassified Streptomyces TaxID=2593676 RepID=UPI0033B8197E
MEQSTDLTRVGADAAVGHVLLAVADHFTENNPTKELEPVALLIAFGAEAYRLTDRSIGGGGQALAKAAFEAAPELIPGTTRGEYALILRTAAKDGAEWGDDANEPVIPRITGIPSPRNPKPTVPTQPTDGER